MKLDQNEVRRGTWWFFGGGLFALAVVFFIYSLDISLENSTYDKDNATKMRELRNASGTVARGTNVDYRLKVQSNR